MLMSTTLLMCQSFIDLFTMYIPPMEMCTKEKHLMITKTATLMVQVTSMESKSHTMTLTSPMKSITMEIRALLMTAQLVPMKHLSLPISLV